MGTRWTRGWAAGLLVVGVASSAALPTSAHARAASPDVDVIVDGTSAEAAAAAVFAAGGTVTAPLEVIGAVAASVPAHAVAGLGAQGFVVVPDRSVALTGEQFLPDGEGVENVNEQVLALNPGSVGGPAAGQGTTVALVDSGVYPHPDLAGRLRAGVDLTPGEGTGDSLEDGYGHGTFMAGLIAGEHTGVAPGAEIVSIKVADADGETSLSQLLVGIGWAVVNQDELGIDVLSLSFGAETKLPPQNDPLVQAVEVAWATGLTVVVAAGNGGTDGVTSPGSAPSVLTVGATDHLGSASPADDVLAAFSGRSPRDAKPELVAPGTSLISLRSPESAVDLANRDNAIQAAQGEGYFVGTGTSMSTALVAGAAAVVEAAHPGATPGDVKSALVDTGIAIGDGSARTVDLEAAATTPAGSAPPADTKGSRGNGKAKGKEPVVTGGWDGARWTGARWTGARWTGARWTMERWVGAEWAGARWTGARWTGARWTMDEWAGARWTGARWTGARWTGARWTGARWTGARWTGARWTMLDVGDGGPR